jgi:hypothetical protein
MDPGEFGAERSTAFGMCAGGEISLPLFQSCANAQHSKEAIDLRLGAWTWLV